MRLSRELTLPWTWGVQSLLIAIECDSVVTFPLADVVSSRRAVDRSPTQHDERVATSIWIISNVLGDNTQAIGVDDLCGSSVIDLPSVSGGVPRG